MHGTPYEALVGFILSVDRSVLLYLLPMGVFFSLATTAVMSRGRRPLELVSIFIISLVLMVLLAWVAFSVVMDRPFFRLEVVRFP
jgi:heme/copper-type cytochrome/quinol oxidase subunit 4